MAFIFIHFLLLINRIVPKKKKSLCRKEASNYVMCHQTRVTVYNQSFKEELQFSQDRASRTYADIPNGPDQVLATQYSPNFSLESKQSRLVRIQNGAKHFWCQNSHYLRVHRLTVLLGLALIL